MRKKLRWSTLKNRMPVPVLIVCLVLSAFGSVGFAAPGKNRLMPSEEPAVVRQTPVKLQSGHLKNDGLRPEKVRVSAAPAATPIPVDTRVRATVNNPSGSSCIMAGFTGTVYCYDPGDPALPYLVNWDNAEDCTFPQDQVCGRLAPFGWWVGADEIEVYTPIPVDTRVRATVNNPSGSSCIMAGFTGTVYCYDPNDPVLPYLVNWDNADACTHSQSQVCGREAPHGWWVGAQEIESIDIWDGAVDLGGGWLWLNWFGTFNVNSAPWIYHTQHRWLYVFGTTQDSIVFFDSAMNDFWWTSDTQYPYLYRFSDSAWLWYYDGTVPNRWFYNYKTGVWEQH